MDEKLKSLWSNNRILFFLALPLILLFVFKDLIFAFLVGSARTVSNEAKKEDSKLQSQATQLDKEAAVAQNKADAAGERIEDRKESDIDENWNKKG